MSSVPRGCLMALQPPCKVFDRGSRNSFQFPRKMFNDMRNNPSMTISPQKGQSLRTAAASAPPAGRENRKGHARLRPRTLAGLRTGIALRNRASFI